MSTTPRSSTHVDKIALGSPALPLVTLLVFGTVLTGTLLIPAVRPFMAAVLPGHEGSMHAFMAVNMAGGIVGAPLLAWLAGRVGHRNTLMVALALVDAGLLYLMSEGADLAALLSMRALQGAVNVGTLSLLLGSLREEGSGGHGRTFGAAAAAMIGAIAFGGPLGTLLLLIGPRAPLRASALIAVAIAIIMATAFSPLAISRPQRERRALWRVLPVIRMPALWIAVERFAVGSFVVTFSLYMHKRFSLSDRHIGALLTCFLVPFALASYPLGRLADRVNRGALLAAGMAVYGLAFLGIALGGAAAMAPLLIVTGIASAAIYSPALCLSASLVDSDQRATSMAWINAAGSLGMVMGTAVAGALSGALHARGWGTRAYPAVFAVTAMVQLAILILSRTTLRTLWEMDAAATLAPALALAPARASVPAVLERGQSARPCVAVLKFPAQDAKTPSDR